jgi:uncharacterized lipoprotein
VKLPFVTLAVLALAACSSSGSDRKSKNELQAECEALVAAETQTRPADVKTISAVPDATGSTVTVSVPGSEVPWVCRADPAGVIEGIGFLQ